VLNVLTSLELGKILDIMEKFMKDKCGSRLCVLEMESKKFFKNSPPNGVQDLYFQDCSFEQIDQETFGLG
jgi:hypothetical protein